NCSVLKDFLDFLMEHDLVEERPAGETRVVYAVTQRGVKVLKRFREVKKMMPVGGEPQSQVLHY
ncbi:MAG: winged helix-turn-helix domain-containing protein, partial [Thermoproteota archaeon]